MVYVTVSQHRSTGGARIHRHIWLERAKAVFMLPIVLMAIAIRLDLFEPDLD